jgi:hypothetical protein
MSYILAQVMIGKWVGMRSLSVEFLLWHPDLAILVLLLRLGVFFALLSFTRHAGHDGWSP